MFEGVIETDGITKYRASVIGSCKVTDILASDWFALKQRYCPPFLQVHEGLMQTYLFKS